MRAKGENTISYMNNDYNTRLERAKLHGRLVFESLDEPLKELPIDLNKIASKHKWGLEYTNLYGEDGYTMFKYKKNGDPKYKICIDSGNIFQRKRFTLAHEIGHIVLGHFEQIRSKELTAYDEYVMDKEADMIAGELLMPYTYMLDHYKWSIRGLTNRFYVSNEAAQVRLDVLKNDFMFLRDIKNKTNVLLDDIESIVSYYY